MQFNRRYNITNKQHTSSDTRTNANHATPDSQLPPLRLSTTAPQPIIGEKGSHDPSSNHPNSLSLHQRLPFGTRIPIRNDFAKSNPKKSTPERSLSPRSRSRSNNPPLKQPQSKVSITPRKQKLRFANGEVAHPNQKKFQFEYDGSHQVYEGSNSGEESLERRTSPHADGPQRTRWPPNVDESPDSTSSISTASREFHQNLCQSISGFPLSSGKGGDQCKPQRSQDTIGQQEQRVISANVPDPCLNNRKGEPCAFHSYMLTQTKFIPLKKAEETTNLAPAADPLPKPSVNRNDLEFAQYLTENISSTEKHDLYREEECAQVHPTSRLPPRGPFSSSGIPNDIQDDLLRIEMLMELRKYKQALGVQLEAQNRMFQMCTSGCPLVPEKTKQHITQNFQQPGQYNTGQKQVHRLTQPTRGKRMDPFKIFEEDRAQKPKESEARPPTVWENDLAKHLNTVEFLSSFAEPRRAGVGTHSLGAGNNNNDGGLNTFTANQMLVDFPGNPKSASILTGATRNVEEFQSSRSFYPSGIMNALKAGQFDEMEASSRLLTHQNSVIGPGAQVNPSYQIGDGYAADFIQKPRAVYQEQQLRHNSFGQPAPDQPQLTSQQQYDQFLMEKNQFLEKLHSFSPDGFRLLNASQPTPDSRVVPTLSQEAGQAIMLRKPVAISKSRSPNNYMMASPPHSTSTGSEDKPAPFLPELIGAMKIRTPGRLSRGVTPTEVEELGNLLSRLPVLSRKQKVEEFAFKTLKPASPVPEIDSETSMIPLASSQGTLASRVLSSAESRPVTVDSRNRSTAARGDPEDFDPDEDMVDTDKMSIHELVTLGRKIYRILSQLSTTSPNKTAPTTPNTAFQTPSSTTHQQNSIMKGQSKSATSAFVDFNTIPNPTFITGPGLVRATQSKSTPKVISTSLKTPPLFKKLVQPPPTRWETRNSQQDLDRQTTGRSMSSFTSRPVSGVQTKTVLKWDTNPSNNISGGITKNSASYTIRNYNNRGDFNSSSQKPVKFSRHDAAYPLQQVSFLEPDAGNGSRTRSKRRNFIKENITKIREVKRMPPQRLRPRQLPIIGRKYDNVQSLISSGMNVRSDRSTSANQDDESRKRSSSLPPNHKSPSQYRNNHYRNGSPSTRPSTIRTNSSKSILKSKSRDSVKMATQDRRTYNIYTNDDNGSKASLRKSRSKTRKASGILSNNIYHNQHSSMSSAEEEMVQKKPTKPKKAQNRNNKGAGEGPSKIKKRVAKVQPVPVLTTNKQNSRRNKAIEEERMNRDGEADEEFIKTTDSEQALIRQMVKAEMDMMVNGYVKDALKRTKEEKEVDYRNFRQSANDELEGDGSVIESENLAPVYTPPRVYDESLFALEKWINPEGTESGTAFTSAKNTSATERRVRAETREVKKGKTKPQNKPQTVRFSLPQKSK